MKNKKFSLSILSICAVAGIIIGSCSKDSDYNNSEKNDDTLNKNSTSISTETDRRKAMLISKDVDWKTLQRNSDKLSAILVIHNISLNDENNYKSEYFFKQIGSDSVEYKLMMKQSKAVSNKIIKKYFSGTEICLSCQTLTKEKKEAYSKFLDELKKNRSVKKNASTSNIRLNLTSSEENSPSCWNVDFFLCGSVCTASVEFPILYALCIGYCMRTHCR